MPEPQVRKPAHPEKKQSRHVRLCMGSEADGECAFFAVGCGLYACPMPTTGVRRPLVGIGKSRLRI